MEFSFVQALFVETLLMVRVSRTSNLTARFLHLVLGIITLGDVLEILPFDDPVVVLQLDGETIWEALEVALELWPAQEG
jgi:hypothetical protein